MTDKQQIKSFYDQFVEVQKRTGINLRHRWIMKWLKSKGLRKTDHVLEIGCGIGTVTYLLAKQTSQGRVLATDISPKSVEMAQAWLHKYPQVSFKVTDMTDFESDSLFDVIVLPDVLEHIPIAEHAALFAKLSQVLKPEGYIFIHMPNPRFLEWQHVHQPEHLQVIDQPIHSDHLMKVAYESGLYLDQLHSYSIFYDTPDYQALFFTKQRPVDKTALQNKYVLGLKTWWAHLFY